MTQEEKQMLLRDLCARLPYSIWGLHRGEDLPLYVIDNSGAYMVLGYNAWFDLDTIPFKPYLCPMSSMTEEEKERLQSLHDIISNENYGDGYSPSAWDAITEWEDYCNSRHLDYHGLIPMGLALEAPEGMYKKIK